MSEELKEANITLFHPPAIEPGDMRAAEALTVSLRTLLGVLKDLSGGAIDAIIANLATDLDLNPVPCVAVSIRADSEETAAAGFALVENVAGVKFDESIRHHIDVLNVWQRLIQVGEVRKWAKK